MTIAVTVTKTHQISIDEYRDFHTTKVFSEHSTILEILEWAKKIDTGATINSIRFSDVEL